MTEKERQEILSKATSMLGEHFDAVQIVVSYPAGKDNQFTGYSARGCGNWFARLALCREFIASYREREQADQIAERINPPEEGEAWKK